MIAPAAAAAPRPDVRNWRRRLTIFFGILGPGIITANVDNDAGGIATYSIAGAHFGYSLLWTLIPITAALIVVQEMSARLGAITGKGLGELIRENYGLRTTFYLMVALLVTDIGNTVAEFAGWAASMEIFGVPRWVSVPIGAFFVWWLVVKGNYKTVEKIFLVACTVYLTYVASALFAKPVWTDVLKQTFEPRIESSAAWILMIIAIVGTTIAPWMQFYLQSSIVEKRIGPEEYRYSRWDVIVGCILAAVVAFFIVVACGATLYPKGIRIEGAEQAAIALRPLAGKWAGTLFAFGLANASLFAASILPLATAYSICEALGFEAGVDKTWAEAPQFNVLYTSMIVIGAGIILIPGVPLFPVLFLSQVLNGLLLPFVLFFVVLLINRTDLMGTYVNGRVWNWIAWGTVAVMVALMFVLVVTTIWPGLFPAAR
ncbi:MAG: Nramp family divalent metal transporter [Thermoanaerobaculia bacterium]|nr:Nramp family divalent metal transporter [Thermoanaerobaculia bacterium]